MCSRGFRVFFSQVAVVSFGGAYAVLAYVAQQAVEHYHWLQPGEMLDGPRPGRDDARTAHHGGAVCRFPRRLPHARRAVAAARGNLGGVLVTWVTFTPCFLWVFLGAPYVEALRGIAALGAALSAVTAAVVGVILNLAVWFGVHVIFRDTVGGMDSG